MTMRHRASGSRGFEALAHPDRLAIMDVVAAAGDDGLASGEVARRVGLSPAMASHHLAWLADADLVASERSGRRVVYRIEAGRLRDVVDRVISILGGDHHWPPFRTGETWILPRLRRIVLKALTSPDGALPHLPVADGAPSARSTGV